LQVKEAIRTIRFQLAEIDKEYSGFSEDLLLQWLNEGCRLMATMAKPFKNQTNIDLAEDTTFQNNSKITPPDDYMEHIKVLWGETSEKVKPLIEGSLEWLHRYEEPDFLKTSHPQYWYHYGSNEIRLYPIPEDGILILHYYSYPEKVGKEDKLPALSGFEVVPVDYAMYQALRIKGHAMASNFYNLFAQNTMQAERHARSRETRGIDRLTTVYMEEG